MKKNIYSVLLGLLLSIGFVSCDNSTDLLFDETAAQRKAGANKAYNDALKSSEQGWLFQYFPEKTQKYGGYNFVLKFAEKGQVTVWSENMADLTKPETSMYDVISYGGPVLTFNTYNSIMHEFANPSRAEYLGKGGDYEFLIISHENDVITLKGIKTGNVLQMTKMTEPAEAYLAKIKVVNNFFKNSALTANIKGTEMDISFRDHHMIFNYTEKDELKSEKVPFIPTPTGISFYKPLSILGITGQDLILKPETNQFVSANNEMIVNVAFAPIDLTKSRWVILTAYESQRSAAFKAAWDQAYAANAKGPNGSLPLSKVINLGQTLNNGSVGLTTKIGSYFVHYNLIFGGVKGHDDYVSIKKVNGGTNWQFVPYFNVLVNVVADNAPYKAEMNDADNPTVVKLTSVADPTVWFILRK